MFVCERNRGIAVIIIIRKVLVGKLESIYGVDCSDWKFLFFDGIVDSRGSACLANMNKEDRSPNASPPLSCPC